MKDEVTRYTAVHRYIDTVAYTAGWLKMSTETESRACDIVLLKIAATMVTMCRCRTVDAAAEHVSQHLEILPTSSKLLSSRRNDKSLR